MGRMLASLLTVTFRGNSQRYLDPVPHQHSAHRSGCGLSTATRVLASVRG